jgi:hypothetical protein
MKITKIISLTFLITIISEMMNAQDTIYFKDKSIISSKIIEIGITEIQYHRFDNLTGPIYSILKKDVKSIKYLNGEIDSISFVASPNKEIVQIETNQSQIVQSKLQLRGMDLYYEGSKLRKRKTNQLIQSNALTENQRNLIMEIKNVKLVGKDQRKLGTGLFVTGLIVPTLTSAAATVIAYAENEQLALPLFFIGVIAGAALRVTGHVYMKIGKNKAKAKKLEFITKHKNNEFIY